MDQRLVVFDLETVPDVTAGRQVLGLEEGVSEGEVRRLMGEFYTREGQSTKAAFIKAPLHRIVCLGAMYANRVDRGVWDIARFGAVHIGVRDERDIVRRFIESLNVSPSPQLVGFNSSSFDLPVLRYRAFALQVPGQTIHNGNGRDYWYRFGKDHIDLCDVMSGFGASPKPSLSELAALLGIRPKANGVDGSVVEAMIVSGNTEEVATYCEVDVAVTYLIFLRYSLVVGSLDEESYGASVGKFEEFIRRHPDKYSQVAALSFVASPR